MKCFLRIIKIGLPVVVAITLLPYAWARLTSGSNRVSIHENESIPIVQQPSSELQLACYNIAHGRGLVHDNWNGESKQVRLARLDAIALQLIETKADIIALNEVDFDCTWSQRINQAEYLAKNAGYRYWVEARNLDAQVATVRWKFGNAILSRYPIEHAEIIDFPALKKWEEYLVGKKRGVVAHINIDGQTIHFASAHLSHRSELIRVESMQKLIELADSTNLPLFIAGDMNSTPATFPLSNTTPSGANAMDLLDSSNKYRRHPVTTPKKNQLTFPSNQPKTVIDWILIPKEFRYNNYQVLSSQLSDHLPIVTGVKLN